MDRRIKYTRMVLNDSLLKFLEKKPIAKITVTEICKDADVNRSTYYAHFTDPYNQLNSLKAEIYGDVRKFTKQIETEHLPAGEHSFRMLKCLLEYIEKNRHIFQILLNKSGDHQLQHDILAFLGKKVFPPDDEKEPDPLRRRYHLLYAANGCFGMFYQWLTEENPVSAEKMAAMMAEFSKEVRV